MARTPPQTQRAPRAAARPRHAVDTGYQRGEETRARIILAAIKCFGEHGFAGASTRDIANEAGVNAPALQYYFDNKEGVYTACVEYIVDVVWTQLGEAVIAAEAVIADPAAGDARLIDAFCALQDRKAGFLEDVPQIDGWHMFMAREQAGLGPDAGFKVFHERLSRRIAAVTGGIVARLCGTSTDDELTLMRAVCISTTGMAFRVMGRSVNCSMGWTGDDPERNRRIRAVIVGQTRDMLELLVKRRDNKADA